MTDFLLALQKCICQVEVEIEHANVGEFADDELEEVHLVVVES